MTWVGPKVPPGLKKGNFLDMSYSLSLSKGRRTSSRGFRIRKGKEIQYFPTPKQRIGIAGEFQPALRSDLDTTVLAAKLTRIAKYDFPLLFPIFLKTRRNQC